MSVKLKRRKQVVAELTREQKMCNELIAACEACDDAAKRLVQALDVRKELFRKCYYHGLLPPHEALMMSHLSERIRGHLRHHGLHKRSMVYPGCGGALINPGGGEVSFVTSAQALLEVAGNWDAKAEEVVGEDFDESDGVIA